MTLSNKSNVNHSVAFYGDMILSRACHEDKIVLWRVEGFDSNNPPLPPSAAPTNFDPKEQTRSAFAKPSPNRYALFSRLLQFSTPDCHSQFFMRFRMFHAKGKHPILAFANAKSRTFFWDLTRFREYNRFMDALHAYEEARAQRLTITSNGAPPLASLPSSSPPDKPHWLPIKKDKPLPTHRSITGTAGPGTGDKSSSTTAATMVPSTTTASASPDPDNVIGLGGYNTRTLTEWAEMYGTRNPQNLIRCHKQNSIEGGFVGRQVAWSPEGDWCVVVGNSNNAVLYHRWGKDKEGGSKGGVGAGGKDRKGSTPAPSATSTMTASVSVLTTATTVTAAGGTSVANGNGNGSRNGSAPPPAMSVGVGVGLGGGGVLAPPPVVGAPGQPPVVPVVGAPGPTYMYGPPGTTPGLFDPQAA